MVNDLFDLGKKIREIENRSLGYEQDFLPNSSEEVFGLRPSETITISEVSMVSTKHSVVSCDLSGVNLDNTIQPYEDVILDLDTSANPTVGVVNDFSNSNFDATWKINATAYYPFNGNADDESVNSNNGTLSGAGWSLVTDYLGNANNAYQCTTDNNKIVINYGAVTGAFTISFWLTIFSYTPYSNNNGNNGLIGHETDFNNGRISFQGSSGSTIGVTVSGNINTVVTLTESMPTDTPFMLTITRDSSDNLKVYKDDTDVTSGTPNRSGTIFFDVLFDNPTNSSWTGLNGIGHNALILSTIDLSASEVANLYDYTSVHKLDKPLVTKNGVTGYEFFGGSYASASTYVIGSSTGGVFPSGTPEASVFVEFTPSIVENANIYYRLFGNTLYPRLFVRSDGSITFQYRYDGVTKNLVSATGLILSDQAYKVLVVLQNNLQEVYVNNVLVASDTETGSLFDGGTNDYLLGRDTNLSYDYNGVIGVPIIINRAVTSNERAKLFSNGRLTGYDPFVIDHSVNGNIDGEFFIDGEYCSSTVFQTKTIF